MLREHDSITALPHKIGLSAGWSSKLLNSSAASIYAERLRGLSHRLSRLYAMYKVERHGGWFWNWNWMRTEPSSGTISVESLADHSSGTRNSRFWPSISRRKPRYR
jgi:hypothetical protein